MMKRSLLVTVWILIGPILIGCKSTGQVLEPLPEPYIGTPPTKIPTPPPIKTPTARTFDKSIRNAVIVIDPGHGGKDPGTGARSSSRLSEKTIVLDIGMQVASSLRDRGARVLCTRTSDTDVSLDRRAEIAEQSHADLFVSIHVNWARRKDASGVDVYIYTQAASQSQKAAFGMVSAFKSAGIECRGMFRGNFHVLREHTRPAMLIECGFLSNAGDLRKLNTASHRSELAAAIADGIVSQFEP